MRKFLWIDFENVDDRDRVVVEWMLSSICNYQCSYCPTRLRDGKVLWPDTNVAQRFCEQVFRHYKGKQITFFFTGGEPTLWSHLQKLSEYVRERGAQVAVLSNGSRSLMWWKNAVQYLDQVILSLHIERANREHFLALVATLVERIPVQINLMMVPTAFEACHQLGREIEHRIPKARIHYKPLLDDWKQLVQYKGVQRKKLQLLNMVTVGAERDERCTFLKGNIRRHDSHGAIEVLSPTQLQLSSENCWEGWECSIGLEALFVRWDQVYRGVCQVGGHLGSIKGDVRFPDQTVRCSQRVCNCIGGIKVTKRRLPII